jgi:hypothetical protein
MDGEKTPSTEPMDIASAFQMVREMDKEAADPGVPVPGAEVGEGQSEPEPEPEPAGQPAQAEPEPAVDNGDGGPAVEPEAYDYTPARQELIRSIQQQAMQNVAQMFNENDVKVVSIQELYSRGEDGTVTFNNPDNPSKPFESRAEAQAWVDAMNAEIQRAYNDNVMQETQRLYSQAAPAMQLLDFAPTYDAMDKQTKETFDMLIEPYAIYGANKQVLGFNCNLNAMAQQAQKIVGKFGGQAPQQPQQQQAQTKPAEPALDMKTGSGKAVPDEEEPKTLEEAMAMLNKRRKNNG